MQLRKVLTSICLWYCNLLPLSQMESFATLVSFIFPNEWLRTYLKMHEIIYGIDIFNTCLLALESITVKTIHYTWQTIKIATNSNFSLVCIVIQTSDKLCILATGHTHWEINAIFDVIYSWHVFHCTPVTTGFVMEAKPTQFYIA